MIRIGTQDHACFIRGLDSSHQGYEVGHLSLQEDFTVFYALSEEGVRESVDKLVHDGVGNSSPHFVLDVRFRAA